MPADLAPQPGDLHFDCIPAAIRLATVQPVTDFLMGHDPFRLQQEKPQEPEFVARQVQALAGKPGATGLEVQFNVPDGYLIGWAANTATDQSAKASGDLFGADRLGDIIVRAGVEGLYPFTPISSRGEDHERLGHACLAQQRCDSLPLRP